MSDKTKKVPKKEEPKVIDIKEIRIALGTIETTAAVHFKIMSIMDAFEKKLSS